MKITFGRKGPEMVFSNRIFLIVWKLTDVVCVADVVSGRALLGQVAVDILVIVGAALLVAGEPGGDPSSRGRRLPLQNPLPDPGALKQPGFVVAGAVVALVAAYAQGGGGENGGQDQEDLEGVGVHVDAVVLVVVFLLWSS